MAKGLVIVITGNGKGKTTSALGLAMRAIGQELKVLMIQFLKSSQVYGELKSAKRLAPDFEIIQAGKDCVYPDGSDQRYDCPNCNFECHVSPAKPDHADKDGVTKAVQLARDKIKSGKYDMIILDEINYAIDYGLLGIEEVLKLIKEKPSDLHLVLTGRNAAPLLVREADLVSEILEIKHPFQTGLKSIRGIDF
ncbi:MAG: cob(I)yrinic acid a,c-diamide adenosyltransferase [Planctomycetes bacterium]|nr:cob(I)yrinic acid a,c-diamide adenosyltransferase [Planctomycetota bacterium]